MLTLHFFQMLFAGAWAYIWQWGVCVGLIVVLLLGAYFTTAIPVIGPFLKGMREHLLWAAFGVAIFLAGWTMGAKAATERAEKQSAIVVKTVDKAVEKAKKGVKQKDPWDRAEY